MSDLTTRFIGAEERNIWQEKVSFDAEDLGRLGMILKNICAFWKIEYLHGRT